MRRALELESDIPSIYAPACNTLFLAYARAFAGAKDAQEIYLGANKDDYTGFLDCRPGFSKAVQAVLNLAICQVHEGNGPKLCTPLLEIVKKTNRCFGKRVKSAPGLWH